MFSKLQVAKFIVSGAVGLGTSKLVKGIIINNVSAPETLYDKITILGAAWAVSGVVAKETKKYTDEKIDETVQTTKDIYEMYKEWMALSRINRNESTFEKEGLKSSDFRKDEQGKWVRFVAVVDSNAV